MKLNPKAIPLSVYLRYLLLNAPGLIGFIVLLLVVEYWVDLPKWIFWALVVFWVAKEVVLFPFVWRAYDPNRPSMTGYMVGKRGKAKSRLNPSGTVQVAGELWRAEAADGGPPIEAGAAVRIVERKGLTLYVVPCKDE